MSDPQGTFDDFDFGLLRLEYSDVFVDVLKSFRRENGRKTLGQCKTYLTTEIWQLSSDFPRLNKLFLPLVGSSISFEDGGLLLALRTRHKMLLCYASVNSSCAQAPPGLLRGICTVVVMSCLVNMSSDVI